MRCACGRFSFGPGITPPVVSVDCDGKPTGESHGPAGCAAAPPKEEGPKAEVTPISPRRDPVCIGGDICAECREGDHGKHLAHLGDICVGCACGTKPHAATPAPAAPQDEAEALWDLPRTSDGPSAIRAALTAAREQGRAEGLKSLREYVDYLRATIDRALATRTNAGEEPGNG